MITAISSAKQSVATNTNAGLKRANNVAFTGNPLNLIKNKGKISRFAEEAVGSIGRGFRKLFGNGELPFSKKPLTADADLTHFLPDGTPITIPMPEVHTTVTKILDGANILKPDAADLATNMVDALATKAALADTLSGASHAFDAVTGGLDVANTKVGVVDALTTGADALATKVDAIDTGRNIIHGIAEILDKIL